jgi:hypothetical protein
LASYSKSTGQPLAIEAGELAQIAAGMNRANHGLDRLIGGFRSRRQAAASAHAAYEHDVPRLGHLARLLDEPGEIGQFILVLVDIHHRRKAAAVPGLETLRLGGVGVLGQHGLHEHEQQALRLGLFACGL